MLRSNSIMSKFCAGTLFLAFCLFPSMQTVRAESDGSTSVYSPVVNGEALRGLSSVGSAESMGAGRITFGVMSPWYRQQKGYLNTPNTGANLYTAAGSFSYGVNSYVDLFASIAGFASNNYVNTNRNAGLGTIRAGAQGSLPFPRLAFLRMGGQTTIIGGTSRNQINTYRADGYNYFETRTGYGFMGKLLQTIQFGSEDWGFKAHLNEAGVMGINNKEPVLLLLGTGLQANLGFAVIGTELNSRTQFSDVSFLTDPLWFTPSLIIRSPFNMNAMAGVDISISKNRSGGDPRALEPYRVFGALAFSLDMLAGRRAAEFAAQEKAVQEKAAMELEADRSAKEVRSLTLKSTNDSIALVNEKQYARVEMDFMQKNADVMANQATADSLALIQAAGDLAEEKEKRSDAEKQLLSTGELLLDAVFFATDKTILTINSKPYLNIIGKMLLKYPKLQIEVAGFTDNIGAVDYNVILSQGRADAVRSYLIEIAPALSSYLGAHGYGMSMPRADNDTKEGRQANRRVELHVLNRSVLQEYGYNQME
ncbi:MAG: OmpA family protein [Chitinispirillaceae bacterium]|nr:OmpA family protein [Chitinispirillaceae bacterium]